MTALAYVPAWREDETIFSWCCLYHRLLGNQSARRTGAELFGVEHACRERWAPLHVQHLAHKVGGTLGSAASMLMQRTPLALFWPFLAPAKRDRILQALSEGSGVGWTTAIGMPAAALAATDLRYCRACVAQDIAECEPPRWRLSHQLAGAWVCIDHGEPLSLFRSRASRWILADDAHGKTLPATDAGVDAQAMAQLKRVAIMARALVGAEAIDLSAVRAAVLCLLRGCGVTGWLHPLSPQRLGDWFGSTHLAVALRHLHSVERRLASGRWIHDLLRTRSAQHPLKWLLLWVALHEAAREDQLVHGFLKPTSEMVAWDSHGQGSLWSSPSDALSAELGASLDDTAHLKSAAKALGMSVEALRQRIRGPGMAANEVASALQWEHRRCQGVEVVHRFIALHPGCTRTLVHKACKAAVTWLAREAPDDLWREMAAVPHLHGGQRSLGFAAP